MNGTADVAGSPEVWFLTGSQELHGQETLSKIADHSCEIAAHLDVKLPVRVMWKRVLAGADAILRTCLEANTAPECVGVIAWMHTFSPANMWSHGLSQLEKPLAHLHTQYNRRLPWSKVDMELVDLNQPTPSEPERTIVVGHWQDDDVIAELGAWSRVICAR